MLIKAGAKINMTDHTGRTALYTAVEVSVTWLLDTLLDSPPLICVQKPYVFEVELEVKAETSF